MNVGSGGGAAAAPAAGGAAAGGADAEEETKEEEKEEGTSLAIVSNSNPTINVFTAKEESDEDIGFGLFD